MKFQRQRRRPPRAPAVVATIHTPAGLRLATKLPPGAVDFFELRLDAMANHVAMIRRLLPHLKAPLIVTVRHHLEGGARLITLRARRNLYAQFLPHAAFLDIELRSIRQLADVLSAARKQKVRLIVSYHDFQRTPATARLTALMAKARRAGADVFKVAAFASRPADIARLLDFLQRARRPALSVMGMGPFGKVSRLLFAQAGSVLNYGFLDKAQLTGQWSALMLKDRIGELED
jgi:3-dehydroquinate dehydratase-1